MVLRSFECGEVLQVVRDMSEGLMGRMRLKRERERSERRGRQTRFMVT